MEEGEGKGEGEEDEEGGEEEDEKEEVKEEVKQPPPLPVYVPKINPITKIMNISRDLDMLNSEVNLISSQFVYNTSSWNTQYPPYNWGKGYGPIYYNVGQNTYSSPVRNTGSFQSYLNNSNHIWISPSKYKSQMYNVPEPTPYISRFSPSATAGLSFGGQNYSPTKYNYAGATSYGYQPQNYANTTPNIGQLLNNIDNVLGDNHTQYINQFSTFSRANTNFMPNNMNYNKYEPIHNTIERTTERPPLYQRPRSVSQRRVEEIRDVNDLYGRNSPERQYTINNTYKPIPAYVKPSSPLKHSRERSPHFNRTSRSLARPAKEYEIRDAIHTLFR